jgi:hypothetical protein
MIPAFKHFSTIDYLPLLRLQKHFSSHASGCRRHLKYSAIKYGGVSSKHDRVLCFLIEAFLISCVK